MENIINIAELLEDCPRGMELDCILFDAKVIYQGLSKRTPIHPIIVQTEHGFEFELTQYGQIHNIVGSNCVIYPKDKTTWEGFHKPFEPGDIVITDNNEHAFIYSGENDSFWECYCGVYCGTRDVCINSRAWSDKKYSIRLATEEEKEKLFQVIKDNGYKWNAESKTLEKLIKPIFKAGNKVRNKNNHNISFIITSIEEDSYICGTKAAFWFDDQDDYELVPNKFDITTLKPFDKVLVRDTDKGCWDITFYELYTEKYPYPHRTLGGNVYKQCIPYEGNEHLMGLVKDCADYYKIWNN